MCKVYASFFTDGNGSPHGPTLLTASHDQVNRTTRICMCVCVKEKKKSGTYQIRPHSLEWISSTFFSVLCVCFKSVKFSFSEWWFATSFFFNLCFSSFPLSLPHNYIKTVQIHSWDLNRLLSSSPASSTDVSSPLSISLKLNTVK